jgi:hypothetical protein
MKARGVKLIEVKYQKYFSEGYTLKYAKSMQFYFTEGGMEYSMRMNDVAVNLKDAGYDQVHKIKDCA